jgi:cell wall-associated NlpC family hydrolase
MAAKLLIMCAFMAIAAAPARAHGSEAAGYRALAAHEAMIKVGTKYRYGGSSPETGFDCSGLVAHVFERTWGITVPRTTDEQRSLGRAVKRTELQAGDLVFYNTRGRPFSHVGIYLGDGHFVHAPRPGAKVRVESIDTSYWRVRFNGARRLDPPTF